MPDGVYRDAAGLRHLRDGQHAAFAEPLETLAGLAEPGSEHPIRPAGEGAEEGGDGDWLVSVLVKPIGEGIDVISGGTRAKSPPGDG